MSNAFSPNVFAANAFASRALSGSGERVEEPADVEPFSITRARFRETLKLPLHQKREWAVRSASTAAFTNLTSRMASSANGDHLSSSLTKAFLEFFQDPSLDFRALARGKEASPPEPIDNISNVLIGVTSIPVPPERIRIEEIKDTLEVQALRSKNTQRIKTGRGMIEITLDLVFPDLKSVNGPLKEIISQFQASPFLTLESHYICDAVYGILDGTSDAPSTEKKKAEEEKALRRAELEATRANLVASLSRLSLLNGDLTQAGSLTGTALIEAAEKALSGLDVRTLPPTLLSERLRRAPFYLEQFKVRYQAYLDTARRAAKVDEGKTRFSYATAILPICLQSLSISPLDGGEGLRAELVVVVFQSLAYTPHFLFRTASGGWTPAIRRCAAWRWYFERRAQRSRATEFREDGPITIRYPVIDSNAPALPTRTGSPPEAHIRYHSLPLSSGGQDTVSEIVVESFGASLNHRLIFQPVLSSQYPSVQFMGSLPGQVLLSILCPHEEIGRFHTLKRHVDEVALHPVGRRLRRATVFIDGEGLPSCLFGWREFQIEALTTETASVDYSRITIRLSVFTNPDPDELKFNADFSGSVNDDRLKRKLDRLFTLAADYKRARKVHGDLESIWGVSSNPIPDPALSYQKLASDLLFNTPAIVSERVLEEVLFQNEALRNSLISELESVVLSPSIKDLIEDLDFSSDDIPRWSDPLRLISQVLAQELLLQWHRGDASLNPSKEVRLLIANTIVDTERFSLEKSQLVAVDYSAHPSMDALDADLEEFASAPSPPNDLYPDLELPTYGEFLADLFGDYTKTLASRYGIEEVNALGLVALPKVANELLRSVSGAPTYRELGRADALPQEENLPAVSLSDYVEPDFYFHRRSAKGRLEERAEVALEHMARWTASAPDQRSAVPPLRELIESSSLEGKRYLEAKLQQGATSPENVGLKDGFKNPLDPNRGIVGREPVEILATYATPEQLSVRAYDDQHGAEKARGVFKNRLRSFRDDVYRMSRAFPTFRLYLIEEDEERLLLLDDWYGFNAVREMHVTRHKWEPDVAEIDLVNMLGTLDEEGYERQGGRQDPIWQSPQRRELGTGEPDPRDVRKFPIQEGTRIVVKMGYSSLETELETVFTGKVTEIARGDVVRLIAQGYAAELTAPCQETEFDLPGWWEKAFRKLGSIFLPISNRHGILNLVSQILSTQPCEHLGAWGLRNILPRSLGGTLASELSRNESFEGVGDLFRVLYADPRLQNVFSSIPLNSQLIDLAKSTLNDEDFQERWIDVHGKTGLQLLRELNTHHPDLIFSVVPLDHRGTLFFGRPDDEYIFTDLFQRERVREMHKQASIIRRSANPVGRDAFQELARGFLSSKEMTAFREFVRIEDGRGRFYNDASDAEIAQNDRQIGADRRSARDLHASLFELLRGEELVKKAIIELLRAVASGRLEDGSLDTGVIAFIDELDVLGDIRAIEPVGANFLPLWDRIEGRSDLPDPDFEGQFGGIAEGLQNRAEALAGRQSFTRLANPDIAIAEARLAYAAFQRYVIGPADQKETVILRRLLFAFRDYIREIGRAGAPQELRSAMIEIDSGREVRRKDRRPFRSYHFVDSIHHIIDNSIVATRSEMENLIYVTGRQDDAERKAGRAAPLKIASIDDDLLVGEYIPGYRTCPNAQFPRQQQMAAYGHLADGLRPMYRGELVLRGNERIKPHDIVWILDLYNGMWGPVEVERVIHHMSYEHGFTTTIIPHLHCSVSNSITWIETMGWNMLLGGVGGGIALGGLVVGAALGGIPGLIAGGVVGATIGNDLVELEAGDYGIFDCLAGYGSFGRRANPVDFYPLMFRGLPFVAGMRGFNADKTTVFSQTTRRFALWSRGAARAVSLARYANSLFGG